MDRLTPQDMLERLVAFPTVSANSNLDLIDFVKTWLAGHGVESTLVFNDERTKANLFATVGPNVAGGVVLSGHTDVVPADEPTWTTSPWTLTERGGRLYGRGTCDMKGFDALALAAVPEMIHAGLKRPIHIALSYDEEIGCVGAPSMIEQMAKVIATPLAVVVGEPTRMKLVTGHKGSIAFMTHVRGHAVHSSRIDTGVSAVMTAARLITWLSDTMMENRRNAKNNPFEPPYTTLHCGMISGGTAFNVVSAECSFATDIRAIPSEDPASFMRRFETFVHDEIEPEMKRIAPDAGVDIVPRSGVPGLKPEDDGEAEALVRELTGDNGSAVVSYGTEAGQFQGAGWSTVVCGPGDIAQAHQANEYLEVSELAAGAQFMQRLIRRLSA